MGELGFLSFVTYNSSFFGYVQSAGIFKFVSDADVKKRLTTSALIK